MSPVRLAVAAFAMCLAGIPSALAAELASPAGSAPLIVKHARPYSAIPCREVRRCFRGGCRFHRVCRFTCPDKWSCYPLYGAYQPYGGTQYWGAYTLSGWGRH